MGKYLSVLNEMSENHTSLMGASGKKPDEYGLTNPQNPQNPGDDSDEKREMYGVSNPQNPQNLSDGDVWADVRTAIEAARRGNHLIFTPDLAAAWRGANELTGCKLSSADLCTVAREMASGESEAHR